MKKLLKTLLSAAVTVSMALSLAVPAFATSSGTWSFEYSTTEETMIASMFKAFLNDSDADLSAYLSVIRKEDSALADTYEDIMNYWKDARTDMTVNRYNPETQLFTDSDGNQITETVSTQQGGGGMPGGMPGGTTTQSTAGDAIKTQSDDATVTNCYTRVVDEDIDEIPENLVDDNSKLCIVCLGYALQNDGTMKNELYGRLLTAYEVYKRYPGSYIAVTGGGTAKENANVTEGGQMADFLINTLGVPEEDVIVENKASNTAGNAINTMKILNEEYPEVDSLFMVTSDYHIARGSTFFNTAAALYKYETGKEYTMVGNTGFATKTTYENNSPMYSMLYGQMYSICDVNRNTATVDLTLDDLTAALDSTTVKEGFDLDLDNATATYKDADGNTYTGDVIDDVIITGYDAEKIGTQTVTVSYTYGDVTKSVDLEVTVEEIEEEAADEDDTATAEETAETTDTVKTGDNSNMMLYASLLVLAAGGYVVLKKVKHE